MIDPSNFENQCFRISSMTTENVGNRAWKRPPRDWKHEVGIERTAQTFWAGPTV